MRAAAGAVECPAAALLWRGSLLPLGRAAAPKISHWPNAGMAMQHRAIALQSSGSKLPRHRERSQEMA
ncbi:hypothetical protein C1886_15835 [Pseudomonas sp. FW300-N1A1]|nr:hypothetical protein C1886_15835 [Pseudomonas sp. FW300-N1A1]